MYVCVHRARRALPSGREYFDVFGFGFEWLSATLFPSQCFGCRQQGEGYLCPVCLAGMTPRREMVGGVPLLTMGSYDGPLRKILSAVKSQGHRAAGRELARHGVDSWLGQSFGLPTVASLHPILASRAGQRMRGFSLPRMLAHELQTRTGWPFLESSLARHFPVDTSLSRGLGVEERWARRRAGENFIPAGGASRGALVLLDDVVTTGATMVVTVSAAQRLGFDPIVCLALAAAPSD